MVEKSIEQRDTDRDTEIRRYGDTERDTARDTEIQRYRETKRDYSERQRATERESYLFFRRLSREFGVVSYRLDRGRGSRSCHCRRSRIRSRHSLPGYRDTYRSRSMLIWCVGENALTVGEMFDRTDLTLPGPQERTREEKRGGRVRRGRERRRRAKHRESRGKFSHLPFYYLLSILLFRSISTSSV